VSGGIVILGAGPTGLGAAYRLRERGEDGFEIFERSGQVGGLATSFVDPKGWTWDVSGHIIFSGYKYFNDFLGKVLGNDGIRWIDRESWIKFEDKYVRYPFQNHLSSLPEQAMLECLIGLVESQTIDKDRAFKNFEEWVLAKFGAGVAKHFMNPYNFKVWATPLKEMGYYWIAERVSVVEWRKAIAATVSSKTTDWGPNAKFGYPLHGGTLGLWKGVLPFLGDRVRYHKRAIGVDEEKREVEFSDGTTRKYDKLLTTLPLEAFVSRLRHAPEAVRAASQKLLFNRLFSVGVGLKRPSPSDKNWVYFPNPKTPFYRMTYLSNYSPEIVPGGDTSRYFSVLTETSYSKFKPLPEGDFGKAVVDGLVDEGILTKADLPLIETIFLIHAGHSYPIPSVDRNASLEVIHAYLEPRGIFSRGRFGSWKYEIGNQDHSLMQGVELVDRWIDGTDEKVFRS